MFWLRSCPRCNGDYYQDRDAFGYFLRCLQCSHEIQLSRRLGQEEQLSAALLQQIRFVPETCDTAAGRRRRAGRHRKVLKVA